MQTPKADHIPQLAADWAEQLENVHGAPELPAILERLMKECERGTVYPPCEDIFRAFLLTPFKKVRVVILGQDPYHGPGQAHGLSFSVPRGVRSPPSLRNIFKEIQRDLGIPPSMSGDLTPWAQQGILLLNASLTVRAGDPGSHQKIGWQQFTDAVIARLSAEREGIIFLLWGNLAWRKEALIDTARHHVLKAAHPSPLSAYRGFSGCGHFSKVNELLQEQGSEPINWSLP